MSETLTIVGVCGETQRKPGSEWVNFAIQVPGKDYPVRLSTKKEDLIRQAEAIGDAVATWTYTEHESENINPKNNRPYMNRYLEGVEAGAQSAPPASTSGDSSAPATQAPAQTGAHEALSAGDRERSIVRQTSIKAVAVLFQGRATHLNGQGDVPINEVLLWADRIEHHILRGIEPPAVDDDIPFFWHDNYSPESTQTEWSDPWRRG